MYYGRFEFEIYFFILLIVCILCRKSRGGFFFQFLDPADPVGSKYQMNGQVLQAQQLIVVFAKENRRKAADMRTRELR